MSPQMNDDHVIHTNATAFGWGWGCSCGKSGTGNSAPSALAARAFALRHVAASERRARRESNAEYYATYKASRGLA